MTTQITTRFTAEFKCHVTKCFISFEEKTGTRYTLERSLTVEDGAFTMYPGDTFEPAWNLAWEVAYNEVLTSWNAYCELLEDPSQHYMEIVKVESTA